MKVLLTGACGFVGSSLAKELLRRVEGLELIGLDNFSRPGSETNRAGLRQLGVALRHGDIRLASDFESLPKVDWVIDAAANPSVLAGVAGSTTSRQLVDHNLGGTLQLIEYCKHHGAGLILLSTSRVYSIEQLAALPMTSEGNAFSPDFAKISESGLSAKGVNEDFSTRPPLSLYGVAKLASELLILEYGRAFSLPVHINRCGVMAGAGQFGRADQGIFAFWLNAWLRRRPLRYIGFGGRGRQVRDCLHPRDLAELLVLQMRKPVPRPRPLNVSGGMPSAISLAQLSLWCAKRFGAHTVAADPAPRPFDVPWLVLDASRAEAEWTWRPRTGLDAILEEIAVHAEQHPDWLDRSLDS